MNRKRKKHVFTAQPTGDYRYEVKDSKGRSYFVAANSRVEAIQKVRAVSRMLKQWH